MVMLPAICDNCGTIFSSRVVAINSKITIKNGKFGPCPACGSMGAIPDGVYDVVDDVINVTALSKLSKNQLLKIRDDLINAQTMEQQEEIIKNSPYGEIVEDNDDFDLKTFINWVILIIQVLTALNSYRESIEKPQEKITITQDEVIEYMIENQVRFEGDGINLE